jgi:NADH-quinone oxidoreductase subunit J
MQQDYPLFYTLHFYLFGLLALVSAVVFVTRKSPISAALWLVSVMFSLAAIYVMLDAHFIGAIQVLVYAGAIMVVFLFVVMLLNLGHPDDVGDARTGWWKLGAGIMGLALLALVGAKLRLEYPQSLAVPAGFAETTLRERNAVGAIAEPLFRDYLLAFELTSILLLVAIVGAVVIGRRRDLRAR